MLTFDVNDDEVMRKIDELVESFDFTAPGRAGASLGEDLAANAADGIARRSNEGLDVEGKPFKPNEAKYAARKLKRYSVDRPGELSGQMLSVQACLGKPEVAPDRIVMRHGNDLAPEDQGYTRSRTGVEMKPYEITASDTDKGVYFTASGREFYQIDEEGADALTARADESLGDHIERAGF